MNWCCIFLSSRDSIHALNAVLHSEPVNIIGHNHWIWGPKFDKMSNYRFIHFYRDPYKKIISGYRYHYDGIEEWSKKILPFEKACAFSNSSFQKRQSISLPQLMEHCESIHICETCCRKAHEIPFNRSNSSPFFGIHSHQSLKMDNNGHSESSVFFSRPFAEYSFMCEHLGKPARGRSLQATLQQLSPEEGILSQAALDLYETLTMARIFNETFSDPHSLNIDLDYMTGNFNQATKQLLSFLSPFIPNPHQRDRLHADLTFFDLKTSPVYRWSMENPVINHVNTQHSLRQSTLDFEKALKNHPDFMEAYRTIFELMNIKT